MADTPLPDQGHIVQALRAAAVNVEQQLAQTSGLEIGQVTILMHLALHQPATIPEVAAAMGHGYRWAQAVLADLRKAGLVLRWPSNPARFALSDAGTRLAEQMSSAVWTTITSANGWPAAVIVSKVLDLLSVAVDVAGPFEASVHPARLTNELVAAQLVAVEPHVIAAWVRSGTVRPPPWAEEDLRHLTGLRGSVTAVWPELLAGARSGDKFADVTTGLGLTTQKVASAISRDPILRAELDKALMQGRDPTIKHGRRLAYWGGCWCPECRGSRVSPK